MKNENNASEFSIRPIRPTDDADIERLIKTVMPEFGAGGPGFAIHDAEVGRMFEAYQGPRSYYAVVERDGQVLGGGGIGPLVGGDPAICELKKMYYYPEVRGVGVGKRMLEMLLGKAVELGYAKCYLETLERMEQANRLYRRFGFTRIDKPMGATGHFGCDRWYLKELGG